MINQKCQPNGGNGTIYHEVFSLFEQLDIPPDEQVVLWNIAQKHKESNQLMNLLGNLLHK